MAIRIVVKDPDPLLREISKPVKQISASTHRLLKDMADTMNDAKGVGIAAPQIGILKRVIVIGQGLLEESSIIEMINPEILERSGSQLGREGCLSIPGLYGEVHRSLNVTVKGLDRYGNELIIEASEYLARIFQHEIDHLNGILYTDIAETIYEREANYIGE